MIFFFFSHCHCYSSLSHSGHFLLMSLYTTSHILSSHSEYPVSNNFSVAQKSATCPFMCIKMPYQEMIYLVIEVDDSLLLIFLTYFWFNICSVSLFLLIQTIIFKHSLQTVISDCFSLPPNFYICTFHSFSVCRKAYFSLSTIYSCSYVFDGIHQLQSPLNYSIIFIPASTRLSQSNK